MTGSRVTVFIIAHVFKAAGSPSTTVPMPGDTRNSSGISPPFLPCSDLCLSSPLLQSFRLCANTVHVFLAALSAGMRVVYDISREPWDRVVSLRIMCTACRVPVFEDVDPDKWYRIAAVRYIVNGGDNFDFSFVKPQDRLDTGRCTAFTFEATRESVS